MIFRRRMKTCGVCYQERLMGSSREMEEELEEARQSDEDLALLKRILGVD